MFKPSTSPAGRSAPPALRLVLPAAVLRATPRPAARQDVTIAHGPLVLQPVPGALLALVPRLMPGPPRALPPGTGWGGQVGLPSGADPSTAPEALVLVVQSASGPSAPCQANTGQSAASGAAWDHWLARCAPEHRLAARARVADLLLLWCDPQGPTFAMLRRGDGWARLAMHAPWSLPPDGGAGDGLALWVPVTELHLPGAGLRTMVLDADPARCPMPPQLGPAGPSAAHPQPHAAVPSPWLYREADIGADGPPAVAGPAQWHGDESRHSRQALALTPSVLQRLQRQRVGVVGAGLEGAALASSLVRLGVDVCVLDATDTAAHDLQADLPPWCEGQPKVQALRRQLQGLSAHHSQIDGRQLPVASPAAGSLLAACDVVIATGSAHALQVAEAWALALLKPFLAVRTDVAPAGSRGSGDVSTPALPETDPVPALAQAWIALLPPGSGCLQCVGRWPASLQAGSLDPAPALRSWSVLAAHVALRLLVHLAAARVSGALVRHLRNGQDGSLQVRDFRPIAASQAGCSRCTALAGAGLLATLGRRTVRPWFEDGRRLTKAVGIANSSHSLIPVHWATSVIATDRKEML